MVYYITGEHTLAYSGLQQYNVHAYMCLREGYILPTVRIHLSLLRTRLLERVPTFRSENPVKSTAKYITLTDWQAKR